MPVAAPSPFSLLEEIFPPRGILQIGVTNTGIGKFVGLNQEASFVLVDSDGDRIERLSSDNCEKCIGINALVAPKNGKAEYFHASNPFESGLVDPAALQLVWRNLHERGREIRTAIDLDSLVQQKQIAALKDKPNWLCINCFPALPILQGGTALLQGLEVVIARLVVHEDSTVVPPDLQRNATENFMHAHGFQAVHMIVERNPRVGHVIFIRNYKSAFQQKAGNLEKLQTRHNKLTRKSKRQETAIGTLKAEITSTTKDSKEKATRISELEGEISGLEKQKNDLTDRIETLAQANEAIIAKAPKAILQKWRGFQQWNPASNGLIGKRPHARILVASMRHCGSTALFNIIRLGLDAAGIKVHTGFAGQKGAFEQLPEGKDVYLIKIHEFRDDALRQSDVIFDARRDIRNTIASAARRKFNKYEALGAVEYAMYNRTLYDAWHPYADMTMEYETLLKAPEQTIRNILNCLGLKNINEAKIAKQLNELPTDQYALTLLSDQHITDPDRKLTYKNTLDVHDIETIEQHHGAWLKRYGYL